MNAELQSRCWACLPKEARQKIKERYEGWNRVIGFETECILYDDLFGHHNLTSDTEPAELLFVERKKVQKLYSQLQDRYKEIKTKTIPKNIGQGHDYVVSERGFVNGAINELKLLFGDKCLPDKTPEETAKEIVDTIKEDIENPIQLPETILMPQPKFNKEDLVGLKGCNTIIPLVIDEIFPNKLKGVFDYTLMGAIGMYSEDDLELYKSHKQEQPSVQVEPKFRKGEKVINKDNQSKYYGQIFTLCEESHYDWKVKDKFGIEYYFMNDSLEPYTEPETKENMEEKELNLVELLKGCDETAFYSPTFGVVLLKAITENDNKPLFWDFGVMTSYTYADGRIYSDSVPTIFPSRALYEKYPLDAKKAWSIWASERKPKFNVKVIIECWQDNDDNPQTKTFGATYSSEEEAQQAAEAVRECLDKFHKDHTEK